MTSFIERPSKQLSLELLPCHKLIGVLQRKGNRARAMSMFFKLYTLIKSTQKSSEKPIELFNRCLDNIVPAFILQRVVRAGKLYMIPVPISRNRALFMGSYWLRQGALKGNNSALTFPQLLFKELQSALAERGAARDFLHATIETAFDQRPFSHFIRRKRKNISKSRNTRIAKLLLKIHRKHVRAAHKRKNRFDFHLSRQLYRSNYRYAILKKKAKKINKKIRYGLIEKRKKKEYLASL